MSAIGCKRAGEEGIQMLSYLLLGVSIFSMVLQNGLFNGVGKKCLKTGADTYYYNSFLYLVCILLFGIMALGSGLSVFTGGWAMVFGVITMLSNFCKLRALGTGPMHITILITTSSMIIPALSGVILFDEALHIGKLAAIAVLLFFIFLSVGKKGERSGSGKWFLYCALAFVFQGSIGVVQKVHQSSVHKEELFAFLAISFTCSFLIARIFAARGERTFRFDKKQYLFAFICGLCTFTMNFLNLKLSGILPSQIFFPAVNGSAILFSSLCSVLVFREKVTTRQIIGLVGGLAALICICIW